jgi:hypothetical protein
MVSARASVIVAKKPLMAYPHIFFTVAPCWRARLSAIAGTW